MHVPRIDTYGVTALEALTEANQDRSFADLVTPLVPAAQRLAYGMLQNPHDCEDAVQEATFKAWRAFSRFREGSDVRAWFLTIVANECRQRRRNRWWSIVKLSQPPVEDPAPDGLNEAAMDLRSALSRLPVEMKLAIVLRYYLDLPFEEVGQVLGVSGKAAKARVHRGLGRLRVEVPEMLGDA
jgi:RNA polymerase sigma-70 factor (ECF subfamily)